MGYLFADYCYSTALEAAAAEMAQPIQPGSGGLLIPVSSDGTNFVYHYAQPGLPASTINFTRQYPSCTDIGFYHNQSGLTLADVQLVAWAVVATWAVGFGVKAIRKSMSAGGSKYDA